MKKTAILATAIAAVLASGVAVAETTVYGKARMGVTLASETQAGFEDKGVFDSSSRFGFKGMEDLGNGLSAIYQFELSYDADGDNGGDVGNRIGLAGLKGDFGTVQIGNQWTPSYLLVRGKHDPFDSFAGGSYRGGFPAPTRVDDAIAYINKFGPGTLAVATVASNGGTGTDFEADSLNDHTDIAISVPVGPVTIGLALASSQDNEVANPPPAVAPESPSPMAINVGWASGPFAVDLGVFDRDVDGADDWMAITGSFKTGSGKILVQFEDFDSAGDNTNIGYHHQLSKKTRLFAEVLTGDVATEQTNVGIHINF